jgi:hypothetical protein
MKRLKFLLLSLAAVLMLVPAVQALAAEDVFKGACQAPGAQNSTACQTKTTANPLTGPNGLITKVTKIISFIAGVAAVIMLLVSGFMFVLSDGDSGKIASARTSLIYAVVGLVIVVTAQGIVVFVLNRL